MDENFPNLIKRGAKNRMTADLVGNKAMTRHWSNILKILKE